ncbi:MAG: helix-turn-helix domain-containing protein [Clostridia bacterium]|nr:helix-turn-helix domain-containing protein [Clostridia bacterium]
MNSYVTGAMIRRLRERKGLTQQQLADTLCVSDKAVSKWETGRGYPDLSLIEPLAGALGVSVIELFSGEDVRNRNRAFDMRKACFYVCPVCGNVIQSAGEALVSCCGIVLPPLEAEPEDGAHRLTVERVEDEFYVTLDHPMSKTHFISFLAAVSDGRVQLAKLYPEGPAEARFKVDRVERIYACCNRHGLFVKKE